MNHAKSIYGSVLASMMFLVIAAAGPQTARAQEAREPLVKSEVIRLLQNGVSADRVGALAKQYGIAFQVNEDTEKQLREAGADDELIGMLRALAPTPKQPPAPTTVQTAKEPPAQPPPPTATAPTKEPPDQPAPATATPPGNEVPSSPAEAVATKLRVLVAPGVTKTEPKDWDNTLSTSHGKLTLSCPKCTPIQTVTVAKTDLVGLHYGQNAYHHWVTGIITGVASLGVGVIIGAMPHHQHFFSIDTKDGRAIGVQADKRNYKEVAAMVQNFAGLPIQVSPKDAHFLSGFNTQIVSTPGK